MEHLGGPLVNEGGVTETSCCRILTILALDQAVGISHRVMAVAVQGAPSLTVFTVMVVMVAVADRSTAADFDAHRCAQCPSLRRPSS
jgi:hypothetical protein